jgi:gas vesicle protein
MDKKSKLFLAFGAGALVGAAVAALFTTDKGKAIVEKAKDKMSDLSEDLKEKIKNFESGISELLKDEEQKENPAG